MTDDDNYPRNMAGYGRMPLAADWPKLRCPQASEDSR
jgi:hypothetical protein